MLFEFQGVEFGDPNTGLIVTDFDPSGPEIRTDYLARPMGHGMIVGRDYIGGETWTFEIVTNGRNTADALEANSRLERAWRAGITASPGETLPMTYTLGGHTRTVYGRPSRYAGVNGDVLTRQGAGHILAEFQVTDPIRYSADEHSASLGIVPASVGGVHSPVVAPVRTVRSGGPQARFLDVTGDAPSPLTVTFYGPVSDPWITVNGIEVGLTGSILYDQSVTIDARTQTVLRNTGQSVAGWLTRRTRLDALRLEPGTHEVTFGGVDPTGTARVELRWRSASYSL